MNYQRIQNSLLPWIGPTIVIACWAIVNKTQLANTTLLPTIPDVVEQLFTITKNGSLLPNLGATLARTFIGLILSLLLGIPLGVYLGAHPKLHKAVEIVIDFFRSLPATAMFPLFLLAFGIGNGSKIATAWFISFWVILVNATYGVLHGSTTRVRVAKSLHTTPWQTLSRILFMNALPQIYIGIRIALSLSLIAVVVSEMFIGSNTGLGQKIYDAYLTYESPTLYAWLIITGITGYIVNKLLLITERRIVHWVGK